MNTAITTNRSGHKLLLKVIIRVIFAFIFIGVLLFVPAGTMKYLNGWLFIAGLTVPILTCPF